jgi:hypothetical protein
VRYDLTAFDRKHSYFSYGSIPGGSTGKIHGQSLQRRKDAAGFLGSCRKFHLQDLQDHQQGRDELEAIRSCDSSKVNVLKNNIPFWHGMLLSPAGGSACGEIYFEACKGAFSIVRFGMERNGHCFGMSDKN